MLLYMCPEIFPRNTEPGSDTQRTATFLVGLSLVAPGPRDYVLAKLHVVEVRDDMLA